MVGAVAVAETGLSRVRLAGATVDLGPYPISLALAALTCALAPAYVIRWHVAFYPSTILEDSIFLTTVAFAVESWRHRTIPEWRTPFTWPAALFLVAGAISVLVPPDHRAALGIYRAYLLEPVVFFFVLVNVIRTPVQATVVGAGLALAGVIVGIANSAVILNALRHHVYNVADTPPVVIYTNANDIALFLVPLIALAGSLFLFSVHRATRAGALAFLVVAVPSTILSFSRGGYLALAGVAVGLALAHRRRWMLISAAGIAAIVLLLIPTINRRIGVELDFANPKNTLVGRSHLWQASLQMLQHHIPFGAGLSGFGKAIYPYWQGIGHTDAFIYPHNFILTFWSETGLLGLAAWIWILVAGFAMGWRGWRSAGAGWRPWELGLLLALVAVVLHGLVDVPYFKNDLALEFWAIVGIAAAGMRWRPGATTHA
jgi:O-antigen ligase